MRDFHASSQPNHGMERAAREDRIVPFCRSSNLPRRTVSEKVQQSAD
jgi:hypothetical protein